MHLQNKIYLQELREQFLQKIVDEWQTKWQINFGDFKNFEAIKNKNAFLEALLADIETSLFKKLNGQSNKYLFSKDFLRRFIYEYGNKDARIQHHSRTGIAFYLGYESWELFLEENKSIENQNVHINYVHINESFLPVLQKTSVIHLENDSFAKIRELKPKLHFKKYVIGITGVLLFVLVGYLGISWWQNHSYSAEELKDIKFSVIKTVGQYPQSVRIAYDVKTLKRVQSIDVELGVGKILAQDKYQSFSSSSTKLSDTISQTYFYPGIYQLKLMVNKKVVRTIYHVVYSKPNQWSSWGFGVAYEKDWVTPISTVKHYTKDGVLHFDSEELPNEIKNENDYRHAVHVLTQNFGVSLDSATIECRMKNPEQEGGESCYNMGVQFTDKNFNGGSADFTMIGCTDFATLTLGKTIYRRTRPFDGKMVDLDSFGVNQNDWNVFKIKILGNVVEVFVNDISAFKSTYETKSPATELVDVRFTFKGAGSIDWVEISNSFTGKTTYQSDFNK